MIGIIGRYEKTAQLFDKNATDTDNGYRSSKYITSTGGENNSSNHIITEYIDISSYTYLTCSNVNTQSSVYNCFYDNNYEKISLFRLDEVPKTVEVPNNAKYIRLSVSKSLIADYMLNEGEIALPYAPYGLVWNDIPYSKLETATDVVTSLPVKVYGDGETDISLLLKGNTETSGNPLPSNPVTISGVGEETANLINVATSNVLFYNGYPSTVFGNFTIQNSVITFTGNQTAFFALPMPAEENTTYHIELKITGGNIDIRIRNYSDFSLDRESSYISTVYNQATSGSLSLSFTTPADTKYVYLEFHHASAVAERTVYDIMINEGNTPIPYEPYGLYKISILKGLTALTPIYLSQQLLKVGDYTDDVNSSGTATYNIAKYEFTGTERVQKNYSEDPTSYLYYTSMTIAADEVICTQLPYGSSIPKTDVGITGRANNNILYLNFGADVMNAQTSGNTANGLKEYLAAQYAAGTPVTVYYVLATPTTETVTAPSIPTTGGEVTLDVDTTVKPSELDLTYHGWHEHQPLKYNNGSWS